MKKKYEMFNDTKIDKNKYEDINLSEEEKQSIKDRMNKKIKYKNTDYRNKILIASVPALIVGVMALSGETAMAYIENIGKQIEYFLNKDNEELRGYKTSVNETKIDKNISVTLNEIMLEDGELLLSLTLDDSKLNKNDLGILKENDIAEFNEPKVKIGDLTFINTGGAMTSELSKDKDRDILLKCRLDSVDTNGDGKVDIENFDLLNDLDLSKNYDVEIIINEVGYTFDKNTEVSNDIKIGGYGGGASENGDVYETKTGYISGDWNFKTTLNSKKLSENIKLYDINKKLDMNYKDMNIKTYLKELRVTPTSIKIKYTYEVENYIGSKNENPIFLDFIIKDENGKIIDSTGASYDLSNNKENVDEEAITFEINKDMKTINIIPIIRDLNYKNEKIEKFEDKAVNLELNR